MSINSLGPEATASPLNNPMNVAPGGPADDAPGQLTLAEIIQEAVRRAGIEAEDGFSKSDVIAINQQIRKDPALLEALAQIRGDLRRRTGKSGDSDDLPGASEGRRKRRRLKDDGSQEDAGEAAASEPDPIVQTDFRVEAVRNVPAGGDITSRMLAALDLDGDGIIGVRQMLQYLIFHEEYSFNRIELWNMLRILNEGMLETFSPRFHIALTEIEAATQTAPAARKSSGDRNLAA